jgi:frataxin-like iron-binding protein CyaY
MHIKDDDFINVALVRGSSVAQMRSLLTLRVTGVTESVFSRHSLFHGCWLSRKVAGTAFPKPQFMALAEEDEDKG